MTYLGGVLYINTDASDTQTRDQAQGALKLQNFPGPLFKARGTSVQ